MVEFPWVEADTTETWSPSSSPDKENEDYS